MNNYTVPKFDIQRIDIHKRSHVIEYCENEDTIKHLVKDLKTHQWFLDCDNSTDVIQFYDCPCGAMLEVDTGKGKDNILKHQYCYGDNGMKCLKEEDFIVRDIIK